MAVIKVFDYTAQVQIAHIPIGVASIDVYLWGGAGGSGGSDFAGEGADAAAGQYVQAAGIDMTAYAGKKSIVVAVGGGGGGGASGQSATGGINGKGMSGYSGGNGGAAGPDGVSGSGGGGGGATTVTLYESGQTLDNIKIAIAGGGGGAGGSGASSRGGAGLNTNSATATTPGYLGENGATHTHDGGGGGGAGGGDKAGKGGSGNVGDLGGYAGYSGGNKVPAGGTSNSGSGLTPQQTPTSVLGYTAYANPLATGGVEGHSGKNGKAIIVFNVPAEGFFKSGGVWKKTPKMYKKVSGVWKRLIGGYVKVSGVWKALFSSDIVFTPNSIGFGDIGGATTSGTTGTHGTPYIENIPPSAPAHQGGDGPGTMPKAPKVGQYSWHPNQSYGFYDPPSYGPSPSEAPAGTVNASRYGNPPSQSSPGGNGCFLKGTLITMADGSQKPVEQVDLKDKVAVGGFVFATGKFLVEDLYDYKGIKVAGSHMVKEDGKWGRVADSKHGIALGDDEHTVYVFGSEYRRIIINGIEFTDYFEIDEKDYLLTKGEKFFGIWREHDRQTQDDSAKILNNE